MTPPSDHSASSQDGLRAPSAHGNSGIAPSYSSLLARVEQLQGERDEAINDLTLSDHSARTWMSRAQAAEALATQLQGEKERLEEALRKLDGDREVRPLHPDRLDRILDFEEQVGQLAGPNDSASLTWADQRALIAEAVLAYRARAALLKKEG